MIKTIKKVFKICVTNNDLKSGGGMSGGSKVIVTPHRLPGMFVLRGKTDTLLTKNLVVGESVYGEKRVSADVSLRCCCHPIFRSHLKFNNIEYLSWRKVKR